MMIKGRTKMQNLANKNSDDVRWCFYRYCNIILYFVYIFCINFTSSQQISVPGRYGYYGATSQSQSPYSIGEQVNRNYQSVSQQHPTSSPYWSFGHGLAEVKHSIRQDDAFRGQRNINSRKHSESRPHDLQRSYDKDYLLVSKTSENDYSPEQILIDQVEIDDLPAGDYEIVAMFDNEDEEKPNSYRRPRLANQRNHPDASNSFSNHHKSDEQVYLKPPGSTFHNDYRHQQHQVTDHHSTPRPNLGHHAKNENHPHHSYYESSGQQSYQRQQIYQQPYQQVQHQQEQKYTLPQEHNHQLKHHQKQQYPHQQQSYHQQRYHQQQQEHQQQQQQYNHEESYQQHLQHINQGQQHQQPRRPQHQGKTHQQLLDIHPQQQHQQPQRQPNQGQAHQQYHPYQKDYYTTPAVHSLPPSSPSRPYQQVTQTESSPYESQYDKRYPTKRPEHNKKYRKESTKNLSRQKLLKQRLNQIIKPYNDYDYEHDGNNDLDAPLQSVQKFENFGNDPTPYTTTSSPVTTPYSIYKTSLAISPSPTSKYHDRNSGYKRHIGQVSKHKSQSIRYSNPTTTRNDHRYYASEPHQSQYFNQYDQSTPSLATPSNLFVTPIPPSSTATTIHSTRKSRTKTRNRYNNRYKDTPRSRPGAKGKGRNLRRIEQKKYPDKTQHLDKLFEIAGQSPKSPQLNALLEIAGGRPSRQIDRGSPTPPAKKEFECPHDGHFGDKDDCSKYYHCAHGVALAGFCPNGLFWNQASDQCDWPESVDCDFDPSTVNKLTKRTYLYLTFDDGPNEGTPNVLEALRALNVPATFFINSDNLEENTRKPGQAERNAHSLLTMIQSGHVLADHSYDHMEHNSHDSPRNAYQNVNRDLSYFGEANISPVLDLMWSARAKENDLAAVNATMSSLVRMPYTNAWRLGRIHHDCFPCTVPAASGQKGIEISNRLEELGKSVIGWDMEWPVNWNTNRLKTGGAAMYGTMNSRHTKSPGKIVLLMHDVAYRDGLGHNSESSAVEELITFLTLAKESGYTFSTLDRYVHDKI